MVLCNPVSYNSSELSQEISKSVVDTEHRENISDLLEVCKGIRLDGAHLFTEGLDSEELLSALLRYDELIVHVKSRTELSKAFVVALLKFSKVPWEIVYSVIKGSSVLEELKHPLWTLKEVDGFPWKIGLMLLGKDPKLLENYFFNIYRRCTDLKSNICKDGSMKWLAKWASQSSEIFWKLAIVMNEFLIFSKHKQLVLNLVKDLLESLRGESSGDWVLLYPVELRAVASALSLLPDSNPARDELSQRLAALHQSDPFMALLLYSHFPAWALS